MLKDPGRARAVSAFGSSRQPKPATPTVAEAAVRGLGASRPEIESIHRSVERRIRVGRR
jgi:hypothetical protein